MAFEKPELSGLDQSPTQLLILQSPDACLRKASGILRQEQLPTVFDVKTLSPHHRRNHGDPVSEGLENLDPGPTAVADRNDHQVSLGQFGHHGWDTTGHSHPRRIVQFDDPTVGITNQPDPNIWDLSSDPREDFADEPTSGIGVRAILERALHQ